MTMTVGAAGGVEDGFAEGQNTAAGHGQRERTVDKDNTASDGERLAGIWSVSCCR